MMGRHVYAILAGTLLLCPVYAEDWPYPTGLTSHKIKGCVTSLVLPAGLTKSRPAPLIVGLHSPRSSADELARLLSRLDPDAVVCAPQCTDAFWRRRDLMTVLEAAAHLKETLPIDPRKVHVVLSGVNKFIQESIFTVMVNLIAFDDDLRPCSAVLVSGYFGGGSVPKWAKKSLRVLVLGRAGGGFAKAPRLRRTGDLLAGKVRSVEVRLQPTKFGLLGWPQELLPYFKWWLGVQEGRFIPGVDLNFDWTRDLAAAVDSLRGKKTGGVLVYVYDPTDAPKPEAKALQNEVFMDPLVRHFGSQLRCVKLKGVQTAVALGLPVKTTPAVAVVTPAGKVKKLFAGKVNARSLASVLRSVAPDKTMPER